MVGGGGRFKLHNTAFALPTMNDLSSRNLVMFQRLNFKDLI